MRSSQRTEAPRLSGFTLVELIVVMAIIVTLAAITAALLPGIMRTEKITQGANMIQGMLLAAKQRALRDQVGAGVRFLATTDPVNLKRTICTEMIYVIKPDDLFISGDSMTLTLSSPFQATSTTQDFSGGLYLQDTTLTSEQFPVQEGDYLELYGGGTVTAITAVLQPVSNGPYTRLQTYSNPSTGQPVTDYRIIRGPRRVIGEDSVKLPKDIVIVMSDKGFATNAISLNVPQRQVPFGSLVSSPATLFYEVLFSPSGGVIGQGAASTDKIIFYVWDRSRDN